MSGLLLIIMIVVVIWVFVKKSENKKIDKAYASFQSTEYNQPTYVFNPSEVNKKIIRALLYFAKADGQMRQDELEIIANFLLRMQPEHKDTDIYYLTDRIKDLKPYSTEEYHGFIKQLDKSSLENLMTWMMSIFGTQKKNHPYEDILIEELKQAIANDSEAKL